MQLKFIGKAEERKMQNKFQRVKDALKEVILSGKYPIGTKLPTESELMAQYDVSRYTVRRAVGALVDEHFINRIQGGGMFVQDWHQDWSNEKDSKLIGIITTHIADYIFPNIISGIDQVISEKDYSLLISNTHNSHEKERKSLINMLDNKVAGLIIEPTQSALDNPNMDLYQEIQDDQIPTLFINAGYSNLKFPVITNDDNSAERELIDYLFELGHQSILGIFQVDDLQGVNRMNGFIQAYQNRPEIAYKSKMIMYQSGDEIDKILNKINNYLQDADELTAIACYNDKLAIRVIDFLKAKGKSIPEDISVVGFDDYQMSQYISPGLTTMQHKKNQMGQDAGKQLLKMIDDKPGQSMTYQPKIIKRESVKDLRKE